MKCMKLIQGNSYQILTHTCHKKTNTKKRQRQKQRLRKRTKTKKGGKIRMQCINAIQCKFYEILAQKTTAQASKKLQKMKITVTVT